MKSIGKSAAIVGTHATVSAGRATASNMVTLSVFQKQSAGGMSIMSGNKYGNRKWTLDGKTFDSQREARRYQELRYLLRMGLISELELQVPFELIPSQKRDGKVVERPVKYIADFVYKENGETVVEDVKSPATRTPQYIIKRKLMLWEFGLVVREV